MTVISASVMDPLPQATRELVGLAERAREGERQAFGDLVERFWPELVGLARVVLAGDAEAEDLVQEAFVHAWQRIGSLRRPESFGAWMRQIVVRRCISYARRRRHAVEIPERGASDPTPGARLDVSRLLAALPARQRAAIYLTEVEGRSDREVGDLLGLRPATVRVHRFRGMKRLRELAEEQS